MLAMASIQEIVHLIQVGLTSGPEKVATLAHILSGPQCEQWLNPESRAAVNVSNPNKREFFTAEIELGGAQRADLVLQQPNAAATAHNILKIGEGKVIPNEGNAAILTPLTKLRDQLDGHKSGVPTAEVFGVIFAVWRAFNVNRRGTGTEMLKEFFGRAEDRAKEVFAGSQYTFPMGSGFREVLALTPTGVGQFQTTVGLGILAVVRN
jgi:hypothetical protein